MPFEKGTSGNPNGRPTGSRNKAGEGIRNMIADLLEQQFEQVPHDLNTLEPKDRLRLIIDLLPFVVPKQRAVSNSLQFEKMCEEDLDYIINELKQDYEEH